MSYPSLDSSKFPRIDYLTTSGVYATLLFSEQVEDPAYDYETLAVDNTAISGSRQTAYFRIDEFFEPTLNWITEADLNHWKEFFKHARTGLTFRYYPNRTLSTYTTYTLEEKNFTPRQTQGIPNYFSFRLRFKKEPF